VVAFDFVVVASCTVSIAVPDPLASTPHVNLPVAESYRIVWLSREQLPNPPWKNPLEMLSCEVEATP